MSKIDEIRSAMVTAMKAGEKEKKETLSHTAIPARGCCSMEM